MISGPVCQMCNANRLIYMGMMNAVNVYFCPYCDRPHPRDESPDWRRR